MFCQYKDHLAKWPFLLEPALKIWGILKDIIAVYGFLRLKSVWEDGLGVIQTILSWAPAVWP